MPSLPAKHIACTTADYFGGVIMVAGVEPHGGGDLSGVGPGQAGERAFGMEKQAVVLQYRGERVAIQEHRG